MRNSVVIIDFLYGHVLSVSISMFFANISQKENIDILLKKTFLGIMKANKNKYFFMKKLIFAIILFGSGMISANAQAGLAKSIMDLDPAVFYAQDSVSYTAISSEMMTKVQSILYKNKWKVLDRDFVTNNMKPLSEVYLQMCCLDTLYVSTPEGLVIYVVIEKTNGVVRTRFYLME